MDTCFAVPTPRLPSTGPARDYILGRTRLLILPFVPGPVATDSIDWGVR